MAGDWIKMRVDLHTHPKVVRIVSAVCPQNVRSPSSRCQIVGALHAMWSLFDVHSTDGELRGYSPETLDALVGLDGFTAAVAEVGWLAITPNSLVMPDFGTHNGKGAKRRAEDTASKRVRRLSADCPQEQRTKCGPEKRRAIDDDEEVSSFSDEKMKQRIAVLRHRPDWLPPGKPWVSEPMARNLARNPRLTAAIVEAAAKVAREGRNTLKNPAGCFIAEIQKALAAKSPEPQGTGDPQ